MPTYWAVAGSHPFGEPLSLFRRLDGVEDYCDQEDDNGGGAHDQRGMEAVYPNQLVNYLTRRCESLLSQP